MFAHSKFLLGNAAFEATASREMRWSLEPRESLCSNKCLFLVKNLSNDR
jgi:hypothetical protein